MEDSAPQVDSLEKAIEDERARSSFQFEPVQQYETGLLPNQVGIQISQAKGLKFLPVKDVLADVYIQDATAVIKMVHEYYNPTKINGKQLTDAIECTFNFPKRADSVISKMVVQIGNQAVQTVIMEKQQAEEKYEDAIAKNNAAIILKQKRVGSEEIHSLQIGNIMPGQIARVEINIIQQLKVEAGCFAFILPNQYFPQFQTLAQTGHFHFRCLLNTQQQITELSHPDNVSIEKRGATQVTLQKFNGGVEDLKDMEIYYRTKDMDQPKFYYQRCPEKFPNCVAVQAQFFPTFQKPNAQVIKQNLQVDTNASALDEVAVDPAADEGLNPICYYFLFDRSGSMEGRSLRIAREALKLFVQSLPDGSFFHIISFGSGFKYMAKEGKNFDDPEVREPFEYNNQTLQYVKDEIDKFEADFGGTEILLPLKDIFRSELKSSYRRRIILLTDGDVDNHAQIFKCIENHCDPNGDNKIFTLGIGSDVKPRLIKSSAVKGFGDFALLKNAKQLRQLRSKVVEMLSKAKDPALNDCQFQFFNEPQPEEDHLFNDEDNIERPLGQLFRYNIVRVNTIMTEDQFRDALACKFTSSFDPITKNSVSQEFSQDMFKLFNSADVIEAQAVNSQMDDKNTHLFKLAANDKMEELQAIVDSKGKNRASNEIQQIIQLSQMYQVLSEHTAFVGEVKQDVKPQGTVQVTIQGANLQNIDEFEQQRAAAGVKQVKISTKSRGEAGQQNQAAQVQNDLDDDLEDAKGDDFGGDNMSDWGGSADEDYDEEHDDDLGNHAAQIQGGACEQAHAGTDCDEHWDYILPQVKTAPDGTFQEFSYAQLIDCQQSNGSWGEENFGGIVGFLEQKHQGMIVSLQEMLSQIENDLKNQIMQYALTSLAVTVLEKKFKDCRDEYKLIVKKAKKWTKDMFDQILESDAFHHEITENEDLEDLEETIENLGAFLKQLEWNDDEEE